MSRLILMAACVLSTTTLWGQRLPTEWKPSQSTNWYAGDNWTNGVPSLSSMAVISDGTVNAQPRLQNNPSAGDLLVGREQGDAPSKANLSITGTRLTVLNSLWVGHTKSSDVTASLTTKGGQETPGDVFVGEVMSAGVIQPANFLPRSSRVTANVTIDGALRALDNSSPSLDVGQLNGLGTIQAAMKVSNRIGDIQRGFTSVSVGSIGQGGDGIVRADLEAVRLNGTGQSSLLVGTNSGKGSATGQLTIRDGINGFSFAQIGNGGQQGSATGTLDVGGTVDISNLEIGNKQQTGFGQVRFLPGSAFVGKVMTIHPGSDVSATNLLVGEISNSGTFSVADYVNETSLLQINGDYFQSSSGVTELDVRTPDPKFGYERLDVTGETRLSGRFDIRFADNFQSNGQTLEFVSASSVDGNSSFRLINAPQDLAVIPSFEKGFQLKLVQPEPLKFANSGKDQLNWGDQELWGGQLPATNNELVLRNDFDFPQFMTIDFGEAQEVTVGGTGGMDLTVIEGGTLTATHGVTVEAGSSFGLPKATLITDQLQLLRGSLFDNASGNVIGDIFNEGRVEVGTFDNQRLSIDGDLFQTELGVIELDLLHFDTFDQIVVDGEASLRGNLFINLPDAFDIPNISPGVEIPLITASGGLVIDDLDIHLIGPPLKGINWRIEENDNGLSMMAIAASFPSLGDMNADGVKDDTDALAFGKALTDLSAYWVSDLSNGVHPLFPGDLNFDNQLDLDDIEPFLACLEIEFCLPEFEVVPEPGITQSGMLALAGLFVACSRRRTCTGCKDSR